jgi:hypothetical protein
MWTPSCDPGSGNRPPKTNEPTGPAGIQILSPSENEVVPTSFLLKAEAQLDGTVTYRVRTPEGRTLIDWQEVHGLGDPSGHAKFDLKITIPGSKIHEVIVELGMRSGKNSEVHYRVARRVKLPR